MTQLVEVPTQIELKNVLFATDFSPAADHAQHYATELARRFGAQLYAVHVKPPDNALPFRQTWPVLEETCQTEIKNLRNKLKKEFPGIHSEVLLGEGSVWTILEMVIADKQIDLIVVGTHGRTGIKKLFLGSVAEDIVRRALCPVLTVGPHSHSERRREGMFSEILYATNFSDSSQAAAVHAISLAREYQAHLTVLHVIEAVEDVNYAARLESAALSHMKALVAPEMALRYGPRFVVEHGVASEKILEVANARTADLIVMGIRKRGLIPGGATHLPTVAHQVIVRSTCPVLTVRGWQGKIHRLHSRAGDTN